MIINIALWSLFTLFSIILVFLFIPYRIAVTGHVQWQKQQKSGYATINFGGKRRGISISPFPTTKFAFGSFEKPFFSYSLKKPRAKTNIPYTRIGRSILNQIRFDQFYLKGDIGLPNPMHTGIIYGWSQSMVNMFQSKKLDIKINSKYNNRFETDFQGRFRIKLIPGKVLWNATKTYFKFRQ